MNRLFITWQIILISLILTLFMCFFVVIDECNETHKEFEIRLKQNEYYLTELQNNFNKLYKCYMTDERIEDFGWEKLNEIETREVRE